MPYVTIKVRDSLNSGAEPTNAGELNYVITKLVDNYIERLGGPNYALLNEVIGVLECSKLELYRRVISVYEDLKTSENGDVYTQIPKKPVW